MKELAAALVKAQKSMPVVHKTATANAGTFTYQYVTLDQLIEKTKPILVANDLVISQFPAETSAGGPGLRTILMHGASGEAIEATVPLLLNGKHDMQTLGGAISYARRYGWAAVLGIANDEDDDGAAASAPGAGAAQVSAPSPGTTANGSAGGGRAAGSGTAQVPPAAPTDQKFTPPVGAQRTAASLKWKYGEHAGKTLEETPLEFVINYAETGKPGFMVDKCREFLAEHGQYGDADEGIPF